MTSVRTLPPAAIPSIARPRRSAPYRTPRAADIWRWLVHNVRVAFHASAEGERHALHHRPEVIRALIHHADVALVTTRDRNGRLHTQPMMPLEREFDGEIWFPIAAAMPVVEHVRSRSDIQVTYLDRESAHRCVVLDGIAHLVGQSDGAASSWRSRFTTRRPARAHNDGPAYIRVDVLCVDVWE